MTRETPTVVHLAYPRRAQDTRYDPVIHDFWWSTSSDSPAPINTSSSTVSQPAISSFSATSVSPPTASADSASAPVTSTSTSLDSNAIPITVTSSLPIAITEAQTTITTLSQTTYTTTQMPSALPASQTALSDVQVNPVCIGEGIDAQSIGLISTVVVSCVVGLLLWVSSALSVAYTRHSSCRRPYSLSYVPDTVKYMPQENGLSNRSAWVPIGCLTTLH